MLPNEPTIHSKNSSYYLVFYDSDRRPTKKWVPLRTKSKRTAKRRAKPLTADYMQGDFDPWTDDPEATVPAVEEAVTSFLEARRGDLSERTWRTYKYDLEPFAERFHGRRLDAITPSEIGAWARRDDVSNRTVEKRLTELTTFYNHFLDRQIIDYNPVGSLSTPQVESDPPRYLSRSEYQNLVNEIQAYVEAWQKGDPEPQQQASREWLLHGVQLAVSTGLRRGSLVALRWQDIDFEDEYVYAWADAAKRDGHTVPLFEDARAVLDAIGPEDRGLVLTRADGTAVPPSTFSKQFARFRERTGLDAEVTLHTCRHTFASWLVQEGVPLYKVSHWLGHSSIEVTEQYAHLAPTQSDDTAEEVFS